MGPPCELVEVDGLPLEAVEPPVLGTAGGVSVPVIMNLDAREKYQGNVVTINTYVGAVREVEFRMREQRLVAVFDYSHLVEVQTGAVLDLVALQEAHVQAAGKSRMISFITISE